jgi:type I restriction enzyme S subunit
VLARVDACRDRLDRLPALLKRFRQSILAAATSGQLTEDWRVNNSCTRQWTEQPLGAIILEMRNGLSPKPSEQPPGAKILRISSVRPGKLDFYDHRYLVVDSATLNQYQLKQDDLLFTRYNGSLDFVGVCAIVPELSEGFVYPDKLIRVRVDRKKVAPKYVEITFGSQSVRSQVEDFIKSSAGQKGISGGDLKTTNIPIPPLPEQTEIVRRVEILFAFADRLEARLASARRQVSQLTPALLAKAFRGELVAQDPADEPASELLKRLAAQREAAPKAKRTRAKS